MYFGIVVSLAIFIQAPWDFLRDVVIVRNDVLLFQFLPSRSMPLISMFLIGGLIGLKQYSFPKKLVLVSCITLLFASRTQYFVLIEILLLPIIVVYFGNSKIRVATLYNKLGDISYGDLSDIY